MPLTVSPWPNEGLPKSLHRGGDPPLVVDLRRRDVPVTQQVLHLLMSTPASSNKVAVAAASA
jgi:hypothetical protein